MSYTTAFNGPLIVKRVRDAIILNFRRVFATDPLYTYSENLDGTVNFDCSKITINDATAEDNFSLPAIVVMTLSGEEHRFMQEDFFNEFVDTTDETVTRRGAPMSFTVSVEATALDVITRDELTDRMYQKFKIVTDDLADRGVGIWKTSLRADRREFRGDRWWYTSGVDLHLYAEWLEEDIVDPNTTVAGLSGSITTNAGINQPFKINNF